MKLYSLYTSIVHNTVQLFIYFMYTTSSKLEKCKVSVSHRVETGSLKYYCIFLIDYTPQLS